jgi:hypothetical protein
MSGTATGSGRSCRSDWRTRLLFFTETADLLIRMSTGVSAITGTQSAMRRNDCPRWAGICHVGALGVSSLLSYRICADGEGPAKESVFWTK